MAVLLSLAAAMMLVLVSYVHRDLETAMSGKDTGMSSASVHAACHITQLPCCTCSTCRKFTQLSVPGITAGWRHAVGLFQRVVHSRVMSR